MGYTTHIYAGMHTDEIYIILFSTDNRRYTMVNIMFTVCIIFVCGVVWLLCSTLPGAGLFIITIALPLYLHRHLILLTPKYTNISYGSQMLPHVSLWDVMKCIWICNILIVTCGTLLYPPMFIVKHCEHCYYSYIL